MYNIKDNIKNILIYPNPKGYKMFFIKTKFYPLGMGY